MHLNTSPLGGGQNNLLTACAAIISPSPTKTQYFRCSNDFQSNSIIGVAYEVCLTSAGNDAGNLTGSSFFFFNFVLLNLKIISNNNN